MAIDFPTSPTLNDTYTFNGKTYSYNGDAWVGVAAVFASGVAAFLVSPTGENLDAALTTSLPVAGGGTGGTTAETARAGLSAASFEAGAGLGLLTNPFFEISQENGTTAGAAATAYYTADQWYSLESSDAVLSVQNVATPFSATATLKRLQSSIKATATTADGTIAAAQYIQPVVQVIEGTFWRSLGWGGSDARAVDIVMVVQCSVTGTYPVAITNAAGNRAYCTTISLTANTPTVCMVTIPGDTGGTWVTTNAASAKLFIGSVGGTDYQVTTLATWEATDNFTHSTCTNWAASGTTNFFQVGYCQAFPAGVLPFTSAAEITGEALQLLLNMRRPYDVEYARCKRYFQRTVSGNSNYFMLLQAYSTTRAFAPIKLVPEMRTLPSIAASSSGHFSLANATAAGLAVTTLAYAGAGATNEITLDATVASGLVAGYTTNLYSSNASATLDMNARM